ncbi:MAG: hemolysin family protein [Actinomycetota bacterium]
MESTTVGNVLLVLLFVLIGGVFAGTEMAIVNLRESQVRRIEESGPRGQRIGALVRNPNRFLSAVQIGVTVAGFLSSAYGASTIAPDLVPGLMELGVGEGLAGTVALVGMTLVIAYLSLVLGELAPKRLAMQDAERVTRIVAPPLNAFAQLMRPVIWFLSKSSNAVVRLLGGDPNVHTEAVSVEEIRAFVTSADELAEAHRRILHDVFDAAERTVVEVMRPRTEVNFMAAASTVSEALGSMRGLPNSRYPVYREDTDDIVGFIHVRDLLRMKDQDGVTVGEVARPIIMFPGTVQVLSALARMRKGEHQIAIVVDEYGGTDGIVTLEDLLEEIVGEIYDEYDQSRQPEDSVLDQGGTLEVDSRLILQEFAQLTGIELPDDGSYQTVGGYVMSRLGRVAVSGDVVRLPGYELRVVDAKRQRIGRIRVARVAEGAT